MHRLLAIISLLVPLFSVVAAELKYSHDVTSWEESALPPNSRQGDREAWAYAASYSHFEWRVFIQDGKPSASHGEDATGKKPDRPKFLPTAGKFDEGTAFAAVDDGWLVGFNRGEFGADLYWFSPDGTRSYKISDHQVVDFFTLPDGIYAIEGLAHMRMSKGSVIRIARTNPNAHWEAMSVVKLPFAPYAVSLRRDGTMLITLSDSLVAIGPDHKIRTLLADAPWEGLYPNSSILQSGEQRLYIGMRQFVGGFDLTTSKFRFLIPSKEFLNKLPKEDEERISNQFGDKPRRKRSASLNLFISVIVGILFLVVCAFWMSRRHYSHKFIKK